MTTSFASRFAGVATLALAALPMAALATAATAAPAPVAIQVKDIDLNSASGQAEFHQRAEKAVKDFCKVETRDRLRSAEPCVTGAKAEVAEKFAVAKAAQRSSRGQVAAR